MQALFYPGSPFEQGYTIRILFDHLGYTVTLDPDDPFDFAVAWKDATWVPPPPVLEAIARRKPVLNLGCIDISKRHVEAVFQDVFGYGTFVVPTAHQGRCVKKFNENAWGGMLIDCPVERVERQFVYQRYIDTSHDGLTAEYRTPVILGTIPLIFILHKEIPVRLIRRATHRFDVAAPGEVFTPEERRHILTFCRRIRLDVGELDILRSKKSGRLYILDANKTVVGLPGSGQGLEKQIAQLSQTFEKGLHALFKTKARS